MQKDEDNSISLKRKSITIVSPSNEPKKKYIKENEECKSDFGVVDKSSEDIVLFNINGEIIEVLKSKIKRNNNNFNKLLVSYNKEKPICLCNDITPIGFKYFYLYLQKENFKITNSDTVDLLITVIQFHDKEYANENRSKFLKIIDDDMVIRLLELVPLIEEKNVREMLKEIITPYFQTNMSIFFDPSINIILWI